jgi:hypothetical protein
VTYCSSIHLNIRQDCFLMHYLKKEGHLIIAHKIKYRSVFLKTEDSKVVSAYIQVNILITIMPKGNKHQELLLFTTIILC